MDQNSSGPLPGTGVTAVVAERIREEIAVRPTGTSETWTRFNLKSCPRCQGDLYLERDHELVFAKCLQCARIYYDVEADQEPWLILAESGPQRKAA